jgi:hypothetical protein
MNKKSIAQWRQRMKQFHRETQDGLGGFAAAIVRVDELPSIAQSKDRDALALSNTVVKWKVLIESGTWQLCLACEYKFRSSKLARAFVFMQPICEEPTTAMIVGRLRRVQRERGRGAVRDRVPRLSRDGSG